MKTLVIHPLDITTNFLMPVYSTVLDKTVVRGGVSKANLMEMIDKHDRILMMGHGVPYGLLSLGRFYETGIYIVDHTMVSLLKKKENSVFIWCYAAQYVERHNLTGWFSDMFVSEVRESIVVGMKGIEQSQVEQSNQTFGNIASRYINIPCPREICENVKREYSLVALENPCARYNVERLGFSQN